MCIHKVKECKKSYQKMEPVKEFGKYNMRQLYFGLLVLAL